ncbi:hypothetical protein KY312_03930 [Candidatus Woesearchaeota archaeon]|nr:hypothetical protein [Candidatus Woesearchaeota archaeon]
MRKKQNLEETCSMHEVGSYKDKHNVNCISFGPDNKLAVGYGNGLINILKKGSVVCSRKGKSAVVGISFSRDGNYAACCDFFNHVKLFDSELNELAEFLVNEPLYVSFTPDSKHLAIADRGENTKVYRVCDGNLEANLGIYDCIAFGPNEMFAYSFGATIGKKEKDNVFSIKVCTQFGFMEYCPTGLSFHPNGKCLAASGYHQSEGYVFLFGVNHSLVRKTNMLFDRQVYDVSFSQDGNNLAVAVEPNEIRFFEVKK